jgi:hypothetical protein
MNTYTTIQEARQALLAQGYRSAGFGAMTGAECWKRDGKAVFIRRRRNVSGVVVG